MRTLPDSANLDQLRKQAKDLLAELRRTRPDATLVDAQANLARQHGYSTWADLKSDVERLAASRTLVADPSLADTLVTAYGLGSSAGPMRHVEREWAGHIWELDTTEGPVVFTELFDHVVPDDVEVECGLVTRAMSAGVLAPPPLLGKESAYVVRVGGRPWRAHRVIPLGPPPPQPPALNVAEEGGRILATIHGLRLPPPKPVVPWLTRRWTRDAWDGLVTTARDEKRPWVDALEAAVPDYLALHAFDDGRDPNPRAILTKAWHAPAGVRVASVGRLITCGWEHASAVPPDWEVGGCLMAWSETVHGGFDVEAAQAFLRGYRELAGDTITVAPAIFTAGVTAQLNWVISRVNIALNDPDETERELADRNVQVLVDNPLSVSQIEDLITSLA
jgi:hypothetical protein